MKRFANGVFVLLAATATCAVPTAARAQERVVVGLRGSYVPLYSGNASGGRNDGWGMTAEIALPLDVLGAFEAAGFYTLVPGSDDPSGRRSRIQMGGGTLSLSRGIESRLSVVGLVGFGVVAYSGSSSSAAPCVPPYCAGVGSGPSGRHPTFIGGLGLESALKGRVRARADVKLHLPIGADASGVTGDRRTDVGVGLRYLLW